MQLEVICKVGAGAYKFQSSPAPEGECNVTFEAIATVSRAMFQSSPAPEGECNWVYDGRTDGQLTVSILTRP